MQAHLLKCQKERILYRHDHIVLEAFEPRVDVHVASHDLFDQVDFFSFFWDHMGNILALFMELDWVYTLKEVGNESLRVALDHWFNQLCTFSKNIDEFLIWQEEQSWELASPSFQEIQESIPDDVTILIVLHENGQEVLLRIDSIYLRRLPKWLGGLVVQSLDLQEELRFSW